MFGSRLMLLGACLAAVDVFSGMPDEPTPIRLNVQSKKLTA